MTGRLCLLFLGVEHHGTERVVFGLDSDDEVVAVVGVSGENVVKFAEVWGLFIRVGKLGPEIAILFSDSS